MQDVFAEIADWSTGVRAMIAVALTVLGVAGLLLAFVNSFRASQGGAKSVISLMYAGWSMNPHEVLASWSREEAAATVGGFRRRRTTRAKQAIVFDTIAELCLAALVFMMIAVIEDLEIAEWVDELAAEAAWLTTVGALLALLNAFSQIRTIGHWVAQGRVWWLGVCFTMTALLRVLLLGAGALWVVVAASSLAPVR